jgi:hypothetical protein
MRRREFLNTVGAVGAGTTLAGLAACESDVTNKTTDDLNALPDPSSDLVSHCSRILKQNLLKSGETFVIATPMVYDPDYLLGMLVAASEIGATGMHAAVISHPVRGPKGNDRRQKPQGYALNKVHWDLYATANLFISTSIGKIPGLPSPTTSYGTTVGDHPYRSDHEFLNRAGSKTRWLSLGKSVEYQKKFFPTQERKERTMRATILMDEAQGELHVTNAAGTDWTCSTVGRPGHAQYGIADIPGRWDNFGYGCIATGPVEDSAEGVVVLQPGDMIPSFTGWAGVKSRILEEAITLTFEGGRVRKIEGGGQARQFEAMMASYNAPEAYGIGHFGWGSHENTELNSESDVSHYSHNVIGGLLFNIGMNYAHGIGGKEMGYSGLGMTTNIAPNHTHFAMENCNLSVNGKQIIDRGHLSVEGGGIA